MSFAIALISSIVSKYNLCYYHWFFICGKFCGVSCLEGASLRQKEQGSWLGFSLYLCVLFTVSEFVFHCEFSVLSGVRMKSATEKWFICCRLINIDLKSFSHLLFLQDSLQILKNYILQTCIRDIWPFFFCISCIPFCASFKRLDGVCYSL
jgi:hypothetical protein